MNQFCKMKAILRQFSVARTPQQNEVAERRNRTLIEAARTMLADSKLPTTFWAEAVNTACYVQNWSFMRPFGCPVTILNTIDHLGKFDGKADEDQKSSHDDGSKPSSDDGKKVDEDPRKDSECNDQEKEDTQQHLH
ncbi:ribonuclease H-like domain-containing protein [Tanacetum coccineum]